MTALLMIISILFIFMLMPISLFEALRWFSPTLNQILNNKKIFKGEAFLIGWCLYIIAFLIIVFWQITLPVIIISIVAILGAKMLGGWVEHVLTNYTIVRTKDK